MSTILSTQDRPAPIAFNAHIENTASAFSSFFDLVGEIAYCLTLSAQAVSFAVQAAPTGAHSHDAASRLDSWPVDLWVF